VTDDRPVAFAHDGAIAFADHHLVADALFAALAAQVVEPAGRGAVAAPDVLAGVAGPGLLLCLRGLLRLRRLLAALLFGLCRLLTAFAFARLRLRRLLATLAFSWLRLGRLLTAVLFGLGRLLTTFLLGLCRLLTALLLARLALRRLLTALIHLLLLTGSGALVAVAARARALLAAGLLCTLRAGGRDLLRLSRTLLLLRCRSPRRGLLLALLLLRRRSRLTLLLPARLRARRLLLSLARSSAASVAVLLRLCEHERPFVRRADLRIERACGEERGARKQERNCRFIH
jgi:hypothetical protein